MSTVVSHIDSTDDQDTEGMFVDRKVSLVLKVKKRKLISTIWLEFKRIRSESGKI